MAKWQTSKTEKEKTGSREKKMAREKVCDQQRTVQAGKTLATAPLAVVVYVIVATCVVFFIFVYAPLKIGQSLVDAGYRPPLFSSALPTPLSGADGGAFFLLYSYALIAVIGIVIMCIGHFGLFVSIYGFFFGLALGYAAWKFLYYWFMVNCHFIVLGWLHLFAPRQTPVEKHVAYSAIGWIFFQTCILFAAAAIVVLFVETWRHYHREMATFDAKKRLKHE